MQRLIRVYKDEMNGHELDMHKGWAAGKGWPLPISADPVDILTVKLTEAAREQIDYDPDTGNLIGSITR